MNINQNAAGQPGGAGRSRLVIHPSELQEVAEETFKAAALLSVTDVEPGDLPLFDHLSAIARVKGFQHGEVIVSLIQRPDQAAREKVLALVREAIACIGGPGEMFDCVDMISAPDGRPQ